MEKAHNTVYKFVEDITHQLRSEKNQLEMSFNLSLSVEGDVAVCDSESAKTMRERLAFNTWISSEFERWYAEVIRSAADIQVHGDTYLDRFIRFAPTDAIEDLRRRMHALQSILRGRSEQQSPPKPADLSECLLRVLSDFSWANMRCLSRIKELESITSKKRELKRNRLVRCRIVNEDMQVEKAVSGYLQSSNLLAGELSNRLRHVSELLTAVFQYQRHQCVSSIYLNQRRSSAFELEEVSYSIPSMACLYPGCRSPLFREFDEMLAHLKRHHSLQVCDACGSRGSTVEWLRTHIESLHPIGLASELESIDDEGREYCQALIGYEALRFLSESWPDHDPSQFICPWCKASENSICSLSETASQSEFCISAMLNTPSSPSSTTKLDNAFAASSSSSVKEATFQLPSSSDPDIPKATNFLALANHLSCHFRGLVLEISKALSTSDEGHIQYHALGWNIHKQAAKIGENFDRLFTPERWQERPKSKASIVTLTKLKNAFAGWCLDVEIETKKEVDSRKLFIETICESHYGAVHVKNLSDCLEGLATDLDELLGKCSSISFRLELLHDAEKRLLPAKEPVSEKVEMNADREDWVLSRFGEDFDVSVRRVEKGLSTLLTGYSCEGLKNHLFKTERTAAISFCVAEKCYLPMCSQRENRVIDFNRKLKGYLPAEFPFIDEEASRQWSRLKHAADTYRVMAEQRYHLYETESQSFRHSGRIPVKSSTSVPSPMLRLDFVFAEPLLFSICPFGSCAQRDCRNGIFRNDKELYRHLKDTHPEELRLEQLGSMCDWSKECRKEPPEAGTLLPLVCPNKTSTKIAECNESERVAERNGSSSGGTGNDLVTIRCPLCGMSLERTLNSNSNVDDYLTWFLEHVRAHTNELFRKVREILASYDEREYTSRWKRLKERISLRK
ncbi:hypothetical protein BJ508DRAFT_180839 [Ascobolus immersus RN42]|uniref:C2H2-type domain-containing protein n=1 Tax=Ascobolus immersus RN42 TaxID=1160509 RepID=A0A3N4HUP0_ASCIM|nr:hypothetical protein BJ508DRAFT_180839 [Ascobolus immersus RN42]